MVLNKVNKILEKFELYSSDEKTQEKLLAEMDSMRFIEIVVAIEDEFNITIPDEYLLIEYFRNKESMVDIVKKNTLLQLSEQSNK